MAYIRHRVGIKANPQKVYDALATVEGIAGWWTRDTTGECEPGKTMLLRFLSPEGTEVGSMTMEVKAMETGKKVQWHFLDGPEEWIGTDVVFDLHEEDGFTIVIFSHNNWKEEVDFKAHCSMKWAIFMLSLKALVETGKGYPSPDDIKIDNWN
jgi:uncharacterized protein YndB with AHSA1/START domain